MPLHGSGIERFVEDRYFARLTVEFEIRDALAIGLRITDGEKLHDQGFARLDIDADLFTRTDSVEVDKRGQDAEIRVHRLVFCELDENLRV